MNITAVLPGPGGGRVSGLCWIAMPSSRPRLQAHSDPDRRATGIAADLGKITQLVDHPQAVAVPVGGAGSQPGRCPASVGPGTGAGSATHHLEVANTSNAMADIPQFRA